MKLVYGISRWTNASRAETRHIDRGDRKPLCGGRGHKASSWEDDIGEPTCRYCIRIYENEKFDSHKPICLPDKAGN